MSDQNEERMKELLRQTLPPISDGELRRNLWPALQARATAQTALPPWLDWALAGCVLAFALSFPAAIPLFFYCL
jgi:hypothetical protein